MNTTQGRSFLSTIVIFLIALLLLGMAMQLLIRSYLTDTTFDRLEVCSGEVTKLASAYHANDGTLNNATFQINVNSLATASQTDVIICDFRGTPALHFTEDGTRGPKGNTIRADYRRQIESTGCIRFTGPMDGFYEQSRYVSARPVVSNQDVVAYVLCSVSTESTTIVISRISNIFMVGAVGALLISVIAVAYFSKRHSHPLREMAQKARAFGHGELETRVTITGSEPQEVEELAIAFNNMAASLQKSEYSRQEFVANVSHELKTPMTTISGYIDGILDGTIPPEKSAYYLRIVSAETKRLSRLVRSMLDISQLQSEGGIPPEQLTRFDVTECAGQMLITFEQKITSRNIRVDVDMPECPIYTVAQQDYISQVIYNLLDNAVKFCPDGGRLSLRVREDDSKIYVSVGNDGQTIPAEELPLLFDRFHKLDKSRAENRDGWGLGLYIVKTIIGLHGEDISATSRDGFTEFTFTLPLMN